jgi:hypothetical protein
MEMGNCQEKEDVERYKNDDISGVIGTALIRRIYRDLIRP